MPLSERSAAAMFECGIPGYMHDSIINYYNHGLEPGGFLSAVINNDLRGACGRADDTNRHCLFAYMMWFYNHAPAGTWGYKNAVSDWLKAFHSSKEKASGASHE